MMASSHVLVGMAAWYGAAMALKLPTAHHPEAFALAGLGALLPDIDHPGSWAGRRLRIISVPLSMLVGHRGVTHSLLAVAGCLLLLSWGGLGWLAVPVTVGYLSHLVGDALTPSGVPLLWPWRRSFSLKLFRTGSFFEIVFAGLLSAGLAFSGYAWNDPQKALSQVRSIADGLEKKYQF